MSLDLDEIDEALRRINKSTGSGTKPGLARDLRAFLGQDEQIWRSRYKLPKYVPFYPWGCLAHYRHISEGHASPGIAEELKLLSQFSNTAGQAKEHERAALDLVKAYIRLPISQAHKFAHSGAELDDLIQESIFGLLHAASKFDAAKGFRFVTYAQNWTVQVMARYVANTSRTIRVPVHAHLVITKARAIMRQDYLRGKQERTIVQIAAELDSSSENLIKLLHADTMSTSLEFWKKSHDQVEEFDLDAHVENLEIVSSTNDALSKLDSRKQYVLRARYGLLVTNESPLSLEEIGQNLGLSRERVRQLEKEAMSAIKALSTSHVLASLIGVEGFSRPENKPKRSRKRSPVNEGSVTKAIASGSRSPSSRLGGPKESTNAKKTRETAITSIPKVEKALNALGSNAPEDLRAAGELRILNKELSLSELAEISSPKLSKDAMAGRLRRLLEMADRFSGDEVATPYLAESPAGLVVLDSVDEDGYPSVAPKLPNWQELVRRTELGIQVAGSSITEDEKELVAWIISRRVHEIDAVVLEVGGLDQLMVKLARLRFIVGEVPMLHSRK